MGALCRTMTGMVRHNLARMCTHRRPTGTRVDHDLRTDEKLLRKIGAEQKLFGGISIRGSIGETSQGTATKSVGVGFNQSW